MTVRDSLRTDALLAGVLALLRAAPIVILALGGQGLPTPGSLDDPVRALTTIGASPDLTIVAGLICATGVVQVFVVLALAERLGGNTHRWNHLCVTFGVISASFLMIDGALGVTALPQLAHMDATRVAVDGAYLATLGVRNGIDRVIPLTLGIWALTAHWPAWRHRDLPRLLVIVGLLLGAAGVAGAALPAAGIASVVLATLWTAGFSIVLLRWSNRPAPLASAERRS
jgi:hypothetical protein